MEENLEDYLRKKKKDSENVITSLEEQKNYWLKSVEELYSNITKWLSPLTNESILLIDYEDIEIKEERLQTYKTQKMFIRSYDGKEICLSPIGSILIGAYGRIDLIYGLESIIFIWVNENFRGLKVEFEYIIESKEEKHKVEKNLNEFDPRKMVWKIVNRKDPNKFVELNERNFKYILQTIL